jgi:NADPH2:quinone reductase
MLTLRCHRPGPGGLDSLSLDDVPAPTAGHGEIVVRVRAAALNYPDLALIENRFHYHPESPFAPGIEIAGEVLSVGRDVSSFTPGDRVTALVDYNGLAEQVAVSVEKRVVRIPDSLDFARAAAYGVTYGTGWYALADRAALQPGETLVVLGAAGGVGLAAIDLGRMMGARVMACASSAGKLAYCASYEPDMLVNYEAEDLAEAILRFTGGQGADVVFDPIGGCHALAALDSIAFGGRHLAVGYSASDAAAVALKKTIVKGCSVVGVASRLFAVHEPERARENLSKLAGWIVDGTLNPYISACYPLARAEEALHELASRRAIGKLVIDLG